MPVITVDTLLEGRTRENVLEWLGDVNHHDALLRAGFDKVEPIGDQSYRCTLGLTGRTLELEYHCLGRDESHGGRRVNVRLEGKRTKGVLHYSLRTMKPSSNTLVTLHADYVAGRFLGPLLDQFDTRDKLEGAFNKVLEAIQRDMPIDE
jgi:hypothetical protein